MILTRGSGLELSFTIPAFAVVGLLDELGNLHTIPEGQRSDVLCSLCALWCDELERQCPGYRMMYNAFNDQGGTPSNLAVFFSLITNNM